MEVVRTFSVFSFNKLVINSVSLQGGIATARRAVEYGAKVALVETARLGGTCVNVGCVPKKVMWNTASIAEALHDAKDYGFNFSDVTFNWKTIKEKRDAYIVRLNNIYANNLKNAKIDFYQGFANYIGNNKVQVGDTVLTGKYSLIATGGYPQIPDVEGAHLGISRY